MKTTISDLWNGNIAPCEHCGAHDPEANVLFARVQCSREQLSEKLTAEEKPILEQYAQLWEDYLLCMMEEAFREGFTLGSRLSAEVFSGED